MPSRSAREEVIVSYRRLFQLALIVVFPKLAGAQFTTFIPPRAQTSDSAKAVMAAAERARTDSSVKAQLAHMKTWVDSAAGLPPAPTSPNPAVDSIARVRRDSVVRPPAAARTDSVAGEVMSTPPRDSVLDKRGLMAPETASALPLMAVSGAGLLLIGGVLLGTVRPSRNRA
jgi:hypothetical protein